MSDSTGDSGIAFVRVQQRSNPDVQTYEAVPRVELAARLAEADDGTAVESCDIVLPIPSVARQVENDEYAAFVQRILRTYSRRVGDGDVEALALMLGLAEDIDAAIAVAVKCLRERGYSWAEIGSRLGITRQAAHQRWG